ncbi:hypothetical protein, variant 1 [Batrachochytrium dendrobatidis JEL423]|uniref:Sugar phosphate transporter domain-containing protein n=1 Tax=Batrachochytrium dendrobatidis (strain JEL423) TaxID=403673 RepID=A0A177WBW1_BATDL|nr:hypothetical protein, variant 1 [Batrachochytrium dendrobatidis JEL423]
MNDFELVDSGDLDLEDEYRNSTFEKANSTSLQPMFYNVMFAGLWFAFSTALSLYNKQLLGHDHYNFNYPLFVVSIHSFCQFALSSTLICSFPQQFQPTKTPSMHDYFSRVVPTAVCTALDISLSNASLHYISLSFYTMIKSSTPVWVLVFAFMFGLEKPNWRLVLVILVICSGVVFTVAGEIRFSMIGFLLILGASVMSGLRWSLTQILLQTADMGMNNPVVTLRYLGPIGATLLGTASCFSELFGSGGILQSEFFISIETGLQTVAILLVGAILAFCSKFKTGLFLPFVNIFEQLPSMLYSLVLIALLIFVVTLAEYYLIRNTSVVTLSVIVSCLCTKIHIIISLI